MTVTTGLVCSARYLAALPYSHNIATRAELWLAGSLRATFQMDPNSNIVVDRTNPIRLTAQVLLTEGVAVDLFGVNVPVVPTAAESLFSPFGSELILYRGITYSNGDQELIKLGVVGIETFEADDTGGDLVITVSGSDRMRAVQRAGFSDTYVIPPGTLITSAIQALVAASVPQGMTFNYNLIPSSITTGSTATIYQPGDDPANAICSTGDPPGLATAIGAEAYFDRNGDFTVIPVPDPTVATISYSYDEGLAPETSLNLAEEADRVVSRVNAPNYFIRDGQGTGVAVPIRGIAEDLDPSSPTYVNGVYGRVVDYATSSLYTSVAQCQVAAQAALRLAQGTEEALTLYSVPKPDHYVDDVIEVTRSRAGLVGSTYVIDGFTLNMEPAAALQITCRSVRIGTGFAPAPPPPTAPPLPPLNLQASSITQTSFTVTWATATDATSWVPYRDGRAQPAVTTPSADFTGLTAGKTYTITVDAINAAGQSVPSDPLSVTTSAATGTNAPNPVTSLAEVGTATINSCELDWTASAVDGSHDAASSYSVSGGGTPDVSGVTATITGLLSNTAYVFTVTAHNAGGDSVSNPTVTVQTQSSGGGGVPSPPAGAYVMNFPADFTLNQAADYGQMMMDAVTKFQNSGNKVAAWVKIAPGTYTIKAAVHLGAQTDPPDTTLPIWWVGTAKDRTTTIFTADNATFDMVSNHINGSQFEYLTFKGTGIDRGPKTLQGGHAWGSGTHNVGLWASAIYNQSAINFAGRLTPDKTLTSETPRSITGYMRNNTWSDVIISSPTTDSNATADFDFQSGLLLENIDHTGNRLDFYCVSGIFRNSTFHPMPGVAAPGYELTTGFDAKTQTGPGPWLIQNWTTYGHGGSINTAPLVGSKGYVAGRCTTDVTLDGVVMKDTTQGLEIGDTLNLKVINSTLGTININPNFDATGTVDSSNTYVKVNHGGSADHIVFGGSSAPGVPTGLAASLVTSTSITWTWNPVSGATSYTPNENGVALSTQAGTSITRTGLTADTPYTFKVNAIGSGGTSAYCTAVVQTTAVAVVATWAQSYETSYTETSGGSSARTTAGTVHTLVGDLVVVGIQMRGSTNTSVTSVTDLAGNTYAAIESPGSGTQHGSGALWYTIATHASASNTVTVTPAVSCTVAFDVVGFTGASALDVHTSATATSTTPASGTTTATANANELIVALEGNSTTGPPSNQAFIPPTTINVLADRVSAVSGAGCHLTLSWQISGPVGTQSFSCTDGNAVYCCSIAAFTPTGGTAATIPPTPTSLAASNITQNSLDLSWSDSGSGASAPSSFTIYKGSPAVYLDTDNASPYHVSGLTPSTTYHFQVSASNSAGESAKSTAITPTTSAPSGTSSLDTVVVMFMENRNRATVMGSCPYLASVANTYAQCTNFTATGSGVSEPYYMRFLAATSGVIADSNTQLLTTNSLVDLLEAKGLTWGGFAESLDGQDLQVPFAQGGPTDNGYDNHHFPFAHMANIYNNPTRRKLCVDDTTGTFGGVTGTAGNPLINQLAAAGTLPNFTFWKANVYHDSHNGSVAAMDTWFSQHVPIILNGPQFGAGQKGLLVLVFDGPSSSSIYCVFAGPAAKKNTVSAGAYSHYNILRTIEDGLMGAGHYINANDSGASAMTDLLA